MYYLQTLRFKIFIFFFATSFFIGNEAIGQKSEDTLDFADSLFAMQKYTQSYRLYDSLFTYQKLSSPQMLLKMSYIKEGLGDYTLALFHLNEYYIQTSDERALEKMESLANEFNLRGYNYGESDFVISVYHEYYDQIVLSISFISIIFFGGLLYQKFKLKVRPVSNFVFLSISLIALVIVINTGMGYKEAIVTHPNTYIMSSPSSSSEVLAVISKGNKMPIKKSQDVWLKTEWEDQEAFVKRKNVTPVTSW